MISPFGKIYEVIVDLRNTLYEKNVLKSYKLGAPTVSVGNLTVGGTGKTPLVAFVAEILTEAGEKVCILTRGYGRENPNERILVSDGEKIFADVKNAGDEPFELARKLKGKAFIIADKNRVAAGRWAREKFGVTAFILDDGFQHRRVSRNLDIVCIDATDPFGNGKLLPDGTLREPLKNLKRADAVVITRANLAENLENLKPEILNNNKNCPVFIAHNRFSNLTEIREFHEKQNSKFKIQNSKFKIQKSFAFCALGNPGNFFAQLKKENFNLAAVEVFSDHHFYTQKDIESLEQTAKKTNAEILLTTAKDAVKLKNLKFTFPCFAVENNLFFEDETAFRQLIFEKIRR